MAQDDIISLRSGDATASIARLGAEPVSWTVGGRELIWHRDPAHWARSAPILFPAIGASPGGAVKVAGKRLAMPQHGFARDSMFEVVESRNDAVAFRLVDNIATRESYPFPFVLSVHYFLDASRLSVVFTVDNPGAKPLPYQLGFHPAFPWPLANRDPQRDKLVFASEAVRPVLRPGADGLLVSTAETVTGAALPLSGDLFARGAMVFADAQSPSVTFRWADGAALTIETSAFPHVAIWTKPDAPFLSVEQWTGLPDWQGADGALERRPSICILDPRQRARHSIGFLFSRG